MSLLFLPRGLSQTGPFPPPTLQLHSRLDAPLSIKMQARESGFQATSDPLWLVFGMHLMWQTLNKDV